MPDATGAAGAFGIEIVSMTKRFGAFVALEDVSIKVRPGSFHALLGENGAGKSTLVKCVMGYYRPDEGAVIVGDPFAIGGIWLRLSMMRAEAERRIAQYRVRTRSPDTPLAALSGGNVQRAVLARELDGGAEVMIAANPCFGLDFSAVAQIHAEIVDARNRGAAVLLVSSDLDEILEIADRLVVMFNGLLVYEVRVADADLTEIGRHMAGH